MLGKRLFSGFVFISILIISQQEQSSGKAYNPKVQGFVKTSGTHFVMNGRRWYFNGFNAYWLMYMAADPATREKVTSTFQQASKEGMNIARTWAFSDGGDRPLQFSPGSYNPDMFKVPQ
ncbi:Mannan endo-1,4-beta-mannosidase 4 [Sarracenia purpurea var. burkii]